MGLLILNEEARYCDTPSCGPVVAKEAFQGWIGILPHDRFGSITHYDATTPVESVPMSERKQNGTSTILVVEDEWLIREMIVEHLRDAGWNVIEAASGEDALACLENGAEIDVVFTDIRLNGDLTGWDVGEACRRAVADLPVIYASGHSIEPPRRVDGSLFFPKPYEPEHICLACERLFMARRYSLDK